MDALEVVWVLKRYGGVGVDVERREGVPDGIFRLSEYP